MAASRKSARQAARKKKRSGSKRAGSKRAGSKRAGSKRAGSKRVSAKKRPVRKAAPKRGTRSSSRGGKKATLKGTARKGLRAAREGIDTVRQAGERTWDVLKSTTSQVVDEFRDRLSQNSDPGMPPRSR